MSSNSTKCDCCGAFFGASYDEDFDARLCESCSEKLREDEELREDFESAKFHYDCGQWFS